MSTISGVDTALITNNISGAPIGSVSSIASVLAATIGLGGGGGGGPVVPQEIFLRDSIGRPCVPRGPLITCYYDFFVLYDASTGTLRPYTVVPIYTDYALTTRLDGKTNWWACYGDEATLWPILSSPIACTFRINNTGLCMTDPIDIVC
jgi:hypothetical protein